MEIITIYDKLGLLDHKAEINMLFSECFGGRVLGDLWDWAYIKNPNNAPIVTLCYEENRLVGHYAIMSMPLCMENKTFNSYLSMSTMVAESHRKFGLFPKLATENYKIATELGVDFIMGFPNKLSTPGFKKRLNWILPPADYVAKLNKVQLFQKDTLCTLLSTNKFALNIHDKKTRNWRMSRPGANYVWNDGLLYKEYEEAIDVMYYESADDLEKIPDTTYINILVRHENTQLRDFMLFEYQFGGISIKKEFVPSNINRQMCLSDVF